MNTRSPGLLVLALIATMLAATACATAPRSDSGNGSALVRVQSLATLPTAATVPAATTAPPHPNTPALIGKWSGKWDYNLGSDLNKLEVNFQAADQTSCLGLIRLSYFGGRTTVRHYNRDLPFTCTIDGTSVSLLIPDGPPVSFTLNGAADGTLEGEVGGQTGGHATVRKVK